MYISKQISKWSLKFFFTIGWLFVSLIALNYHQSMIFPKGVMSWVYYLTTFIGHYGILLTLTYYLFFWPVIKFVPHQKVARIWSTAILVTGCFLLFLDSMVFSQYRFHLNGFVFDLVFGGAFSNIFEFPLVSYLIVLSIIFIKIALFWYYGGYLWKANITHQYPKKIRLFSVFFICFLISHFVHAYGSATGMKSVTSVANLFPLNFPLTGESFLIKIGLITKDQTKLINNDNQSNDFFYPSEQMNCKGSTKKNILIILADTWRYDELDESTTPFLNNYAQKGALLKSHFSGSHNTRAGIFNIFYGLPANYWSYALNNQKGPVLIDSILSNNYELGIFASASLQSPEFDRTVFSAIKNLRTHTNGNGAVARDLQIVKEWKSWINQYHQKENKNPFFGFLFFDSTHSYAFPKDFNKNYDPIAPSRNHLGLTNFTDPLPIFNLHRKSVSFVDSLMEEVLLDLESKGLDKDTIVIITSDHGDEMNDNKKNYWGHYSNYSFAQIKVPFLIVWPGREELKNIQGITNHYDIVPTLMEEVFNCKNDPSIYSFGQNLFKYRAIDQLIVSSYLDVGVIDFNKEQIQLIDQFGQHSATNLHLDQVDESEINNNLLLKILKDLKRFKIQ